MPEMLADPAAPALRMIGTTVFAPMALLLRVTTIAFSRPESSMK